MGMHTKMNRSPRMRATDLAKKANPRGHTSFAPIRGLRGLVPTVPTVPSGHRGLSSRRPHTRAQGLQMPLCGKEQTPFPVGNSQTEKIWVMTRLTRGLLTRRTLLQRSHAFESRYKSSPTLPLAIKVPEAVAAASPRPQDGLPLCRNQASSV